MFARDDPKLSSNESLADPSLGYFVVNREVTIETGIYPNYEMDESNWIKRGAYCYQ